MTLSIFKDNYQKQQRVVTASLAVSVLLLSLDYIYKLQEYQVLLIYIFDFIIVLLFAKDFSIRLQRHKAKRRKFLINHLYELPAMIPVFVFGIIDTQTIILTNFTIRNLEILTLLRLVHIYCRTIVVFRNHHFLHLVMFTLGAIIAGGFSIYFVKSYLENDSSVNTLRDGLWLMITTMTTFGYGDIYPVTTEGKIIATLIIFVGISILWVFISTIGNSLIQRKINRQKETSNGNYNAELKKESRRKQEISFSFFDDMRGLVIERINSIDKLNDKEIEILIDMIRNLHKHSKNI